MQSDILKFAGLDAADVSTLRDDHDDKKTPEKYKILELKVKRGTEVKVKDPLCLFGLFIKQTCIWKEILFSPHEGKVKRILVDEDEEIDAGEDWIEIEYCTHGTEYNGLCVTCGKDVGQRSDDFSSELNTLIVSGGGGAASRSRGQLQLTNQELLNIRGRNAESLRKSRKLALVLDIDHTFLHATRDPQAKLLAADSFFRDTVHSFQLGPGRALYHVKIRPGFRDFLRSVQEMYDIHVYTNALRNYAEEVVHWIESDPDKPVIHNLVTRDDVAGEKKYLDRLFPCDPSMVIIIDDRLDVWPHEAGNVLQIHKYLFWPEEESTVDKFRPRLGTTRLILKEAVEKDILRELEKKMLDWFRGFGPLGTSVEHDSVIRVFCQNSPPEGKIQRCLSFLQKNPNVRDHLQGARIDFEINSREMMRRDGDRVLPCLTDVLMTIHQRFFDRLDAKEENSAEPDSRDILHEIKGELFRGMFFVFSGIIPAGTDPARATMWRKCASFGANCQLEVDENTTHVVAKRMGTKKTHEALRLGIEVVHSNWVHNSTAHYMLSDCSVFRPEGWDAASERMLSETKQKRQQGENLFKHRKKSGKSGKRKGNNQEGGRATKRRRTEGPKSTTESPVQTLRPTSAEKPGLRGGGFDYLDLNVPDGHIQKRKFEKQVDPLMRPQRQLRRSRKDAMFHANDHDDFHPKVFYPSDTASPTSSSGDDLKEQVPMNDVEMEEDTYMGTVVDVVEQDDVVMQETEDVNLRDDQSIASDEMNEVWNEWGDEDGDGDMDIMALMDRELQSLD